MKTAAVINAYIKFRASLGYRSSLIRSSSINTLMKFADFIGVSKEFDAITDKDCSSFLNGESSEVTTYWKKKYDILKKLFEWACARGYTTKSVIPKHLPKLPDSCPPYIYSDEELKSLFSAALTYSKMESITDPRCVQFILMITYFLGLRISETLSLRIGNIDLENQVVKIEESKFYKSRYVTYNQQVSKFFDSVFEWRRNTGFSMTPEDVLFISKNGKAVNFQTLHSIFAKIRKKAGLYFPERKRHQPRIHDLRHTFAVNVLTSWYKDGRNVQSLLPKLSTYLGHSNVSHTSVYLTRTPQLLEEANKLFYNYKKR